MEHDRLDALRDAVIDGHNPNAGCTMAGPNGYLAGKRYVIDSIRSRAVDGVKNGEVRISLAGAPHCKPGGVGVAIIRAPARRGYRPAIRTARSGAPPIAPAELAFDGNWIGCQDAHRGWKIGLVDVVVPNVSDRRV